MERLGWGVIGIGNIVQGTMAPAMVAEPGCELVAAVSRDQGRADDFAAEFGAAYAYSDYDEMLADDRVEAVIVGVADQYHVSLCMRAIDAGKHVFVEKPLGVSVEECEELREKTRNSGLVLQVGNNRRFDPGIAFARKFVDEELGGRMGFKAWYYDSTYRYTMTDNLQPLVRQSGEA
ncbi:MAG: Gfo/Idh/MocA family protein, partial [Acidimicrobiia bacterium]